MTKAALKGMSGRKLRTALTALAIVLGVAMVAGAYTLTDTMLGAADQLSKASYGGTDAVVNAKQAFDRSFASDSLTTPTIPGAALGKVRALPGVAAAIGDVTDDQTKIIDRKGKPIGTGPFFGGGHESGTHGGESMVPFKLTQGRWPSGRDEVVIDTGTSKDQRFPIGSSVQIKSHGPEQRFRVVGIANFGSVQSLGTATIAVFDLPRAQQLFGKAGQLDGVLVSAKRGIAPKQLRADLSAALPQFRVQSAEADDRFGLDGLKQFIGIIQKALLAFGGVSIFVGAFIIFNTLSITVAQRVREFAMLRTIGASRRQVLASVLTETLVVGIVASLLGLLAGLGLAKMLDAVFRSSGLALPQSGLVFSLRTILVAFGLGVIVTLLAGLAPALRATRVSPVAAMREGAVLPPSRISGWFGRIAATTTLLAVAILAYALFGGGLKIGTRFILMAPGVLLLFVGVALLSPRLVKPLAGVLGWPSERFGRSAGRLARRNATRNPGRTAVTAAALMIGVALVAFVAVLGNGFKKSNTHALERQVRAEYVVYGRDGFSPIDPAAAGAVKSVPGVAGVTGIAQDEARAFGKRTKVDGVDPAAVGRVFRFEWQKGNDSSLQQLNSSGAIVTKTFADDHHLKIGSPLELTSVSGAKLHLRVGGVSDPPAFDPLGLGDVTVSKANYDHAFKTKEDRFTFVDTNATNAATTRALEQRLKPFPDAQIKTAAAFRKEQEKDFDSLLGIFNVMLALAVIVSLFGIVNTLVLSVFERTRELGMLRAVGMTRRQVRRMIRHESVITALIGATLGIAVGLFLAALATAALSQYSVEFVVPVGTLIVFTFIAAIAGVVAAILPARRAARLDPLNALQYE
ncbi:MAG: putative transport system permease protein [Thermoleophilaceae bacterium]|nr:putative transport system permease protein [Thermoleophilaceae bacterium]